MEPGQNLMLISIDNVNVTLVSEDNVNVTFLIFYSNKNIQDDLMIVFRHNNWEEILEMCQERKIRK